MNRGVGFIVLVLLVGIVPAKGWHSPGHRLIAALVPLPSLP